MHLVYSNLMLYLNKGKVGRYTCGCGAGKTFMAITADGSFKPCSHLSLTDKYSSIQEYWKHSQNIQKMRRLNYKSLCGNCKYETICGGCRAICERIHNNIEAGEEDCPAYKSK